MNDINCRGKLKIKYLILTAIILVALALIQSAYAISQNSYADPADKLESLYLDIDNIYSNN